MSNYQYQTFKTGTAVKRLVFFLHGYNSTASDIIPYVKMLSEKISDSLIIVPEAANVSERNPAKKQWYALTDVDPLRRRRQPETSTAEIVAIYNKTGERISQAAKALNNFISSLQKEYAVKNKDTYIMGFSQGAMLALYTGLTRRYRLGGIFPFAGIVCGKDRLEKELSASKPDVYLFHGKDDLSVQYKTLAYTKDWLNDHQIFWESTEYDGLDHKLIADEIDDAAEVINRDK